MTPLPRGDSACNKIGPDLVRAAIDLLEDIEACDSRVPDIIHRRYEALLHGMGVEFIEREGKFSPLDQRVVEIVHTEAPELDGVVAASLHRGYRYLDRIERPQLVVAYKATGRHRGDAVK